MKGWYPMKTTRNTETSRSNDSFPSSGLCLSGTISQRTKRLVPANNPTTEIVTYTVTDDDGHLHYVDDYSPSEYHNIGDKVHIPIFIKASGEFKPAPSPRKSRTFQIPLNIYV
jgi:hypothetical protein